MSTSIPFGLGDLVEVETVSVRALARVREASLGGRLHIAFEMGEYFPWVDTDVRIRHFGNDASHASHASHASTARVLHAGSTTALLQLIDVVASPIARPDPYAIPLPPDTQPSLDEEPPSASS